MNAKDRHGYEEDWGMVVQRLNTEIEKNQKDGNVKPGAVRKARKNTLFDMFEGRKSIKKYKSAYWNNNCYFELRS